MLQRNGYNIDQVMAALAPPCKSMVKKCFWRAKEVSCSNIIQTVKTRYGYCCSFNYYGSSKVVQRIQNTDYRHTSLPGLSYGLRLLLDVEKEQYVSSITSSYGFSILVQDGADYINQNQMPTNLLLAGEELKIAISPTVYVTTENVRNLNLEQRNCLYADEKHLGWSSIYSYHTCMNECRAMAIFEICNCTPFFYPFPNYTRLCNLFDVSCLDINKHKYSSLRLADESFLLDDEEEVQDEKDSEEYLYCDCYPECDKNLFDIQGFSSPAIPMLDSYSNLSVLNVYYNDIECTKIEKDVAYTWHDFLAAIGGIFSLCLGASLISIIECFHFFGNVIYNYCSNRKRKERSLQSRKILLRAYVLQAQKNNSKKTLAQVLEYKS